MYNFIKKIKKKNIIIFADFLNLITKKKKIQNIIKENIKFIKILIKNHNTIILPTYNLRFPILKKTSNNEKFITTGILVKNLLKKFNFKRTKKPMYNYAVLGPNSKKLLDLKQTTAWGEDSVIGYLSKGKNSLGMGVNTNLFSFTWVTIHCCEEKLKVFYRFWKNFIGKNLDNDEFVKERMYVRNLKIKKVDLQQSKILYQLFIEKKLLKKKGKLCDYSIIYLNEYYKKNLNFLPKIIK